MANEEQKPLSAELKALRAEFAEVADRSKKAVAQLDTAIFKAEMAELAERNGKVVDEFALPGNRASLDGHDITILINKSKDMGAGFDSNIGAAINATGKMIGAVQGRDTVISAALFDTGSARSLRFDADRLDKAREKTEANNKDLLVAVKDIMVANTPDKVTARHKHYVIITDGSLSANEEATVQMMETTLRHNPKVTFDFINIGEGGNIANLVGMIHTAASATVPAVHQIADKESIWQTLTGVVKGRLQQTQAPAAEAPKVATAAAVDKPAANP